jgi:hypothetical protein
MPLVPSRLGGSALVTFWMIITLDFVAIPEKLPIRIARNASQTPLWAIHGSPLKASAGWSFNFFISIIRPGLRMKHKVV